MDDETKNADRYYQDKFGSYQLPSDLQEQNRLDEQSFALHELMHGKIFHAPVHPKRILDVGCGTGRLTLLLAQRFPDAEVVGVDIAPVPIMNNSPPNVHFIQSDIKEFARHKDGAFNGDGFDYIFSRLLFMGIIDWPAHIALLVSLLSHDGWIELQELDLTAFAIDGKTVVSEKWLYWSVIKEDLNATGLDMDAGRHLRGYLSQNPQLHNITQVMYRSPMAQHPEVPEGAAMVEYVRRSMIPMFAELLQKVSGPKRGKEETRAIMTDLKETTADIAEGTHVRFFVVFAQLLDRKGV